MYSYWINTCNTLKSTVEIYFLASLSNWSRLYSITVQINKKSKLIFPAPTWAETLTGTLGNGSLAV